VKFERAIITVVVAFAFLEITSEDHARHITR